MELYHPTGVHSQIVHFDDKNRYLLEIFYATSGGSALQTKTDRSKNMNHVLLRSILGAVD
jgi:hypothetical protein